MRLFLKIGFGMTAAIVLIAVSGKAFADGDAANGEKLFEKYCTLCHDLPVMEKNRIGPGLKGVVGRQSGQYPGFNYSTAFAGSGIVWTEEKLDAWLTDPQEMIRGTRMIFAGVKRAEERADIIAFLKANP